MIWQANRLPSTTSLSGAPFRAAWANASSGITAQELFPPPQQSSVAYIYVFFAIQGLSAALILIDTLFTFHSSLNASHILFERMLTVKMGATNRWLDKKPSGRVVNKFSRDGKFIDSSINQSLRYFVTFLIARIISVLTIIVVLPPFLVSTIVLGFANFYITRGYICAARDLRISESVSRSPIFCIFNELL